MEAPLAPRALPPRRPTTQSGREFARFAGRLGPPPLSPSSFSSLQHCTLGLLSPFALDSAHSGGIAQSAPASPRKRIHTDSDRMTSRHSPREQFSGQLPRENQLPLPARARCQRHTPCRATVSWREQ
ncbi:hypothetical protein CALCODRAFT_276141 [Calocera cornea HHB12733]|uniref:Uncharacterized protein n=1 Tax=Calocera cornea HHB12733 TaxID=1353952 RepID=A0A165G397_9BASI|nr:hypothetical protein CALCODRAFT_276141 [Calocera cornea HHB12733]